jgi:hypothetical protein
MTFFCLNLVQARPLLSESPSDSGDLSRYNSILHILIRTAAGHLCETPGHSFELQEKGYDCPCSKYVARPGELQWAGAGRNQKVTQTIEVLNTIFSGVNVM